MNEINRSLEDITKAIRLSSFYGEKLVAIKQVFEKYKDNSEFHQNEMLSEIYNIIKNMRMDFK